MTTSTHDVVIVGTDPAGAATAMLLARAGLDVLALDSAGSGAGTHPTSALMRGGVLQLHRWGLLDAIVAAGTPPVRRTTLTYADETVPITIRRSHGVDALYAPRRAVLDAILVAGARDAGASVRTGTTVIGLTRDDRGRVDGIGGRDRDGRAVHHAARWVIGADGIHSAVARAVDAPDVRRGSSATAVVDAFWPALDIAAYERIFRRDACAGAMPTNGGARVFVAASRGRVGRGGLDALLEIVAMASGELAERIRLAGSPKGVSTFGGLPGRLRRAWGPGWALVGDAGCWHDPISGHGLTDALRDAELLARAITGAAGGARFEVAAFAEFERTRDRLARPLFDVADTIASMRWTDAEIGGLLLQLNSAMSDEVDVLARLPVPPTPRSGRPSTALAASSTTTTTTTTTTNRSTA